MSMLDSIVIHLMSPRDCTISVAIVTLALFCVLRPAASRRASNSFVAARQVVGTMKRQIDDDSSCASPEPSILKKARRLAASPASSSADSPGAHYKKFLTTIGKADDDLPDEDDAWAATVAKHDEHVVTIVVASTLNISGEAVAAGGAPMHRPQIEGDGAHEVADHSCDAQKQRSKAS